MSVAYAPPTRAVALGTCWGSVSTLPQMGNEAASRPQQGPDGKGAVLLEAAMPAQPEAWTDSSERSVAACQPRSEPFTCLPD